MNKEWTLHIENLAKIAEADVKISPLMCFVGDNNSGKSYLMSVLWGVLTLGKDLFPRNPSDSKSYKACEKWLREHINCNHQLSSDDTEVYVHWFNDLLSLNKKTLLRRIFNYDVECSKIEITGYKREKHIEVKWEAAGERYSSSETYVKFPKKPDYTREEILHMNAYICWNLLMEGIAAPLYTPIVKGRRTGEPVYLPASRTGFMLTYPQLVENSLQISFSTLLQENASKLTLPYVDFLQLITKFEIKGKISQKNAWAVNYIEREMTKGSISVTKDMVPIVKYSPAGTNKELPLYTASSIVSELSPLLLLFKSDIKFKTLIIEEPEAHLHPELQQKMARLIVNLVNRGIPVWITTHSDTILQHINNMLKLSKNEERNELMKHFGYEKEDLLDHKKITMYQFDPTSTGMTLLQELEDSKYGFSVPTFNNALEQLVEEVYAFQEE